MALERTHGQLVSELAAAFTDVVETSGFILSRHVEEFEAAFAEYCGTTQCAGVASGTAALSVALHAAEIGPGDEVIVPAHTFIASALAVAHVGATPVFVDVDPGTGLLDPEAARAAITPQTAAIIPVHLYGQACDVDAIREFSDPAGLFVLEDCAQAHGARLRGRRVGSLGSAAAFSFYPSKNLGALGDGGAICTNSQELADRIRSVRNLGQRDKGVHTDFGVNERLDGLQAALLRVKLPHLDGWNEARRQVAAQYRAGFGDLVRVVEERQESPSVYHLFPIRVPDRAAFAAKLDLLGVDTGIHYDPPVHGHAAWAGYDTKVAGLVPHSEAWASEVLTLPMHPDLRPDEIQKVVEAVKEASSALGVTAE